MQNLKDFSAGQPTAYCTDSPFMQLNPGFLESSLRAGEAVVYERHGDVLCHVVLAGSEIVMAGLTGPHRLHRATTSTERLAAHWLGFMQANRDKYLASIA
jgi:hypothetical protein